MFWFSNLIWEGFKVYFVMSHEIESAVYLVVVSPSNLRDTGNLLFYVKSEPSTTTRIL